MLCMCSDVDYQYFMLQLCDRLIIDLEPDQSILVAVAQERLHLRMTIFSSHNTSGQLYFEKKAKSIYTAFLLLPLTCIQLCVLWTLVSSWLKRDHVGNVNICVESFSLVSSFLCAHNEFSLQERDIEYQIKN